MSFARIQEGAVDCSWIDWFGNKTADLYARKGAGCHPAYPGLVNAISRGKALVGYLGRWLRSIGAFVANHDSPDVQEKVEQGLLGGRIRLSLLRYLRTGQAGVGSPRSCTGKAETSLRMSVDRS